MNSAAGSRVSIGQAVTLACRWEAEAPKAGNVHRRASFCDLSFADLIASAEAIGPVFARSPMRPIGSTVLRAVEASRQASRSNAHLGTILLLAPLAKASATGPVGKSIAAVLESLTVADAAMTYHAIRLAGAGGLGRSRQADVDQEPSITLLEAMQLAAERDLIARQYATCFHDVLDSALPWLEEMLDDGLEPETAIVRLHLRMLSAWPDSLIARKCGPDLALEASRRAAQVLDAGEPSSESYRRAFHEFDDWLRADGNLRNPGAAADLVAATLFVAIREQPLWLANRRARSAAESGDKGS